MGYLPNFESDVFISYAHNDNDLFATEQQGWVAQLHCDLQKRVTGYLGANATLWRDQDNIRNNEDFENVILKRLVKTATLLAVISPSFMEREWCIRELTEFASLAERSFGMHIDDETLRIFKVEKIHVDPSVLPTPLQRAEGYKFYGDHEFRPILGGDYLNRYFEKMDELARDIAGVLKGLARKGSGTDQAAAPRLATPSSVVYLAETTSDLADQAYEIRQDLKSRGFTVLPSSDLPNEAKQLSDKAQEYLTRSVLSIHLIGKNYGVVPEGESDKSKAWLQNDLAMKRGSDPSFVRLVWLVNNGDGPSDARQQHFLDYLREDPDAQKGMELLQKKKLEDLKWILQQKLRAIQEKKNPSSETTSIFRGSTVPQAKDTSQPLRIYIICDQSDRNSSSLVGLKKFLFGRGYEPILPSDNENERDALQEHGDNLTICDAALIFYGQASERWLNTKLMDFRKVLSRRTQPVLAKAIYMAPPETACKKELETHEAILLQGTETFSPETLNPFLDLLRGRLEASA